MAQEVYTKVKVEVLDFEGIKRTYSFKTNRWDLDSGDMAEVFSDIMLQMGYHPDAVDAVFCDGCVEEPCCDDEDCCIVEDLPYNTTTDAPTPYKVSYTEEPCC